MNAPGFPFRAHSIVACAAACALAVPADALATDVALSGLLPGKALVVIDGGRPRTLDVGARTPEGVKLIALEPGAATFEIDGRRQRLVLGQHAAAGSGGDAGKPASVTLIADARGHFMTQGLVNGASMRFLVDTGATSISMSAADAARANVNYRNGQPGTSMTANGPVRVWRVMLNSVKIGDIAAHQVEAVVHENDLPFALLGMSFLNRMEMRRDGTTLTLTKRY